MNRKLLFAAAVCLFFGLTAAFAQQPAFAKRDEFTAKDSMRKFYDAANEPKTVKWYDAAHSLNARATADRLKWLRKNLKQTAKIK